MKNWCRILCVLLMIQSDLAPAMLPGFRPIHDPGLDAYTAKDVGQITWIDIDGAIREVQFVKVQGGTAYWRATGRLGGGAELDGAIKSRPTSGATTSGDAAKANESTAGATAGSGSGSGTDGPGRGFGWTDGVAAGQAIQFAVEGVQAGNKASDRLVAGSRRETQRQLDRTRADSREARRKADSTRQGSARELTEQTADAGIRASRVAPGVGLAPAPLPVANTDLGYNEPVPKADGAPAGLTGRPVDHPDVECGSIIHVDTLTLGERIPLGGSPFSIYYASDRVLGRRGDYQLEIPGTPGSRVNVNLAGREGSARFESNTYAFAWDAVNAAGKVPIGRVRAHVETSQPKKAFDTYLGNYKPTYQGLGGWSLNLVHYLDPVDQRIYLGEGGSRSAAGAKLEHGVYQIPADDGSVVYVFNEAGVHLSTRLGLTGATIWTFEYDQVGHIVSVADAYGVKTTFDRAGTTLKVNAPTGPIAELKLNDEGYLADVSNVLGETYRLTYGSSGLLTQFTKPSGETSEFAYDELGYLRTDRGAGGTSLTFDAARTLGLSGRLDVKMSSAGGGTTAFKLRANADGSYRREKTGPDGLRSRIEAYADGRRRASQPGLEVSTSLDVKTDGTRTTKSRVQIEGLPAQEETVERRSGPDHFSSTQTSIKSSTGTTTLVDYVRERNEVVTTSPLGRRTTLTMNELGQPVRFAMAGRAPIEWTYGPQGRVTQIKQGTRQTSFAYAPNGRVGSLRTVGTAEIHLSHDQIGRVKAVSFDGRPGTSFGYDSGGSLSSVTPPTREAHRFVSNAQGLSTSYLAPAIPGRGETRNTNAYDVNRRLTSITNADGRQTKLTYAAPGGRLDSVAIARGRFDLAYDSLGRVSQITSPDHILTEHEYFGPLPRNDVTTFADRVQSIVKYAYGPGFRPLSLAVPGARADFAYDPDGLLIKAGAEKLERASDSGIVNLARVENANLAFTYDEYGLLRSSEGRVGARFIYAEEVKRDSAGRITMHYDRRSSGETSRGYTYDDQSRLVAEARDGLVVATFSYDQNGNRVRAVLDGRKVEAKVDAQDRLVTYGAINISYDPDGRVNQISRPNASVGYEYDELGQLIAVRPAAGPVITYQADGEGRRAVRLVDGRVDQRYLYGTGLNPIATLDDRGKVDAFFVYGRNPNVPDYIVKGGRTFAIFSDHLGSPRAVVDARTGEVAQELDYDAFGRVLRDTRPGFQPFGFAGGLYDAATELVRFGVRDYNAEFGRWMAKDPIRFAGGDPNLYGYVHGDPVNGTDPTGLEPITLAAMLVGVGIGAGIGGLNAYLRPDSTWESIGSGFAMGGLVGASSVAAGALSLGVAGSVLIGSVLSMGKTTVMALLLHEKIRGKEVFVAGLIGAAGGATGNLVGTRTFFGTSVIGNAAGNDIAAENAAFGEAIGDGVIEGILDHLAEKICE